MTLRAAPWKAGLLVPVALISLAAGACDRGSTTTSSSAPTAALPSSASAARTRFMSCLESHGVPPSVASAGFGDLRPLARSPASTPPSTMPAATSYSGAFEACRSQLPSPGLGGLRGTGFLNSSAGRAYLSCLEAHGLTLPASTSTQTNSAGSFAGITNFRSAEKACTNLAPRAALGGPTPTTTVP